MTLLCHTDPHKDSIIPGRIEKEMKERLSEPGMVDNIRKGLFYRQKTAVYVNSRHVVGTLPLTHTVLVTHCLATSVEQQGQSRPETSRDVSRCFGVRHSCRGCSDKKPAHLYTSELTKRERAWFCSSVFSSFSHAHSFSLKHTEVAQCIRRQAAWNFLFYFCFVFIIFMRLRHF